MSEPRANPGRHRAIGWGLAAATLAIVCLPVLCTPRRDSFPLSTYPMFSRARGSLTIIEALEVKQDLSTEVIAPSLIGGGEALQAHAVLRQTARRGAVALNALCTTLARRLTERGRAFHATQVRIVRTQVQPLEYYLAARPAPPRPIAAGAQPPLAQCPVPKRATP